VCIMRCWIQTIKYHRPVRQHDTRLRYTQRVRPGTVVRSLWFLCTFPKPSLTQMQLRLWTEHVDTWCISYSDRARSADFRVLKPWMQAVIPRVPMTTHEARTCCGVRCIRLHERVSVQPLPNLATECTMTQGSNSGPLGVEQLIAA